jgi:hypothetical protein
VDVVNDPAEPDEEVEEEVDRDEDELNDFRGQ